MYELFLSPLVMASALRLMTPVLFAAMGGSFGHKAKVLGCVLNNVYATQLSTGQSCGGYSKYSHYGHYGNYGSGGSGK